MSEEQRREWTEFLLAKRSLFSVDELLVDLSTQRLSFSTKTFQSLMVLREKEQNRFILDRMDEFYKVAVDDSLSYKGRSNADPCALIQASRQIVLEFHRTCAECAQELHVRNPKVTAHCKSYIRKYADILKGRITLELLFLPGTQEKRFEEMGEKALCAAMELVTEIDELRQFLFLPTDFISTLHSSLFSVGQLISAMLNLSIQRVDAFFATLATLISTQRPQKLADICAALSESLQAIVLDAHYSALKQALHSKVPCPYLFRW
jgi:hypothetical protein